MTKKCVIPDSRKASAEIRENEAGPERRQGIGIFAEAQAKARRSKGANFPAPVFTDLQGKGQERKKPSLLS